MSATQRKWDFKLTTDTPYLALTGELWGVYITRILKKIDRVIKAPHYITLLSTLMTIDT